MTIVIWYKLLGTIKLPWNISNLAWYRAVVYFAHFYIGTESNSSFFSFPSSWILFGGRGCSWWIIKSKMWIKQFSLLITPEIMKGARLILRGKTNLNWLNSRIHCDSWKQQFWWVRSEPLDLISFVNENSCSLPRKQPVEGRGKAVSAFESIRMAGSKLRGITQHAF